MLLDENGRAAVVRNLCKEFVRFAHEVAEMIGRRQIGLG